MINLSYRLGDKPLKTVKDVTLFKNDRCIVTALRGTLALPILINGKTKGYAFHGAGKLLLDAIIKTPRGAIGKPIDRDLTKIFLMVGGAEEIEESLAPAEASDLSRLGYENREAFSERVDEFCGSLFKIGIKHINFDKKEARIFAFQNVHAKPDILLSKRDKLVYTSKKEVYVFKGDKGVIKRPGEVMVSKEGKIVIVKDNSVVMDR